MSEITNVKNQEELGTVSVINHDLIFDRLVEDTVQFLNDHVEFTSDDRQKYLNLLYELRSILPQDYIMITIPIDSYIVKSHTFNCNHTEIVDSMKQYFLAIGTILEFYRKELEYMDNFSSKDLLADFQTND